MTKLDSHPWAWSDLPGTAVDVIPSHVDGAITVTCAGMLTEWGRSVEKDGSSSIEIGWLVTDRRPRQAAQRRYWQCTCCRTRTRLALEDEPISAYAQSNRRNYPAIFPLVVVLSSGAIHIQSAAASVLLSPFVSGRINFDEYLGCAHSNVLTNGFHLSKSELGLEMLLEVA